MAEGSGPNGRNGPDGPGGQRRRGEERPRGGPALAAAPVNGGREGNGRNGPTGRGKWSTEERAANVGAILAAQAHWLVERLLDRQARDFEAEGGFAERLYKARSRARQTDQTDPTDR